MANATATPTACIAIPFPTLRDGARVHHTSTEGSSPWSSKAKRTSGVMSSRASFGSVTSTFATMSRSM